MSTPIPPKHVPQFVQLKYRDTEPMLEVTLKAPTGAIVNLSAVGSVQLHIGLENRSTRLTREMSIYDAANGIIRYSWQPEDWTDAPALVVGVHAMEYELIGTDPERRQTYPNSGHDYLVVVDDLGQG